MDESNIFFATNTYNYGSVYYDTTRNKFKDSRGDLNFFRKIMDFDALKKLKYSEKMGGSLNSSYYVATAKQLHVLDPNFMSGMLTPQRADPIIEAENRANDAEYGYKRNNDYYPLLEEIVIDNKEITYADEMLGKWIKSDQGLEMTADNPFGIYIKQKIEKDTSDGTVSPEDAGIVDIEDTDPYYYLYEETAKKEKKQGLKNRDKVEIYKEKYGSIFRLFSEVSQDEIIQAPISQYSFVNAGPGTGKTYTLIKKIEYMVDELNTDPEGILVLCFTNAAVNEIKARIKKHAQNEGNRAFVNIDVRTFHSFSWLLISQANEIFRDRADYRYIDISRLNYGQSIIEATRIVRKYGDEVFGFVQHLIVDEIQDLTNERAYLVISMVAECIKNNVGITVLGDSCQAIYDYSDDETGIAIKSDLFYEYMISELFDSGKFYKLEKNIRQTDELIDVTKNLRMAILEDNTDDIRKVISIMNIEVPSLTTGNLSVKLSEYNLEKITRNGTLCLMCRNNAQVLATSMNLWKRGIKHIVNAYNEFEYFAGWIGKVFGIFSKKIINQEEFNRLLLSVTDDYDPNEVWARIQDVTGSRNNVLEVVEILSVIEKSKIDDPLFRNVPKGNLVVSNIHKSKGREYDTVVVEESFVKRLIRNLALQSWQAKGYSEEAKVLYVAVTRPKMKLFFNRLATADVSLKRISTGRKRWVRGEGGNLKTIEIRALTDANIMSFNNIDIQLYIAENVSTGDEINLVLDLNSSNISYNIIHFSSVGEKIIGKMSSEFIDDVDAIISPYDSPWPKRITDLYVSGVYSQIKNDYSTVWCWVDFCGLGNALTDIY